MTDYSKECSIVNDRAMFDAREEIRLFCLITDRCYADSFLIGRDPHGTASIGEEFFDMSDIHTVIKEYPRLIMEHKSNEAIADIIDEWHHHIMDIYENHKKEPCINLRSWLMGARPELLKKSNRLN